MNKYVFKEYSSDSPKLFEVEKIKLQDHLGEDFVIDHIGSTAVPNLGGKGIIDIMIRIPKNRHSFIEVIKKLEKVGWEHREKADSSERLFFRKDTEDTFKRIQRYHIHLIKKNSDYWKETIIFREKMKKNPKLIIEYEKIKKKAIIKANKDGQIYRDYKKTFIDKFSK